MSNSQQVSDELIEVHDKLASTFKKRALQVDSIARHAQASEVPSLFAETLMIHRCLTPTISWLKIKKIALKSLERI